jgi:hypothetical protein
MREANQSPGCMKYFYIVVGSLTASVFIVALPWLPDFTVDVAETS